MEWIDRLNAAVSYIEEHLTDEPDYGQMAKIACCSVYHFQRMFGEPSPNPFGRAEMPVR